MHFELAATLYLYSIDFVFSVCRAEHNLLKRGFLDEKFRLNVEFPPYFERASYRMNASDGEENFELIVPVRANPQPTAYRWWKILPAKGQIPQRKVEVARSGRISLTAAGNLLFTEVNQLDEGRYLVEVVNLLGVAEAQISFHVLCKFV